MTDDTPPIELRPSTLIRACADGSWEPDETGFDALLMPVRDLGGEVIDVVAWEFGLPQHWWIRRGIATYAGEHAIYLANRQKQPVRLVATPAEYLKQWGQGMCILNWQADVRAIVNMAEQGIICETPQLAGRVRAAIDKPRSERVKITVAA